MSKMGCICGGMISNTLCPCPTEGWLLRDQDQDELYNVSARDVAAFFAAIQSGRRDEWIKEFFTPQYPTSEPDEAIVYDVLAYHKRKGWLSVAECVQCGRLWVQRGPGVNSYRSYSPDEPGYAAALRASETEHTETG